jgi:hypothetical protein
LEEGREKYKIGNFVGRVGYDFQVSILSRMVASPQCSLQSCVGGCSGNGVRQTAFTIVMLAGAVNWRAPSMFLSRILCHTW